jgi:lincosamide nucleotidyltransferase A/C/D/E
MTAEQAVAVLTALDEAGCWTCVEGGWGVDALAGRQTRPHRDLDVAVDAAQESVVLGVLERLGYAVETDERPTRVELAAPGRGRVDLHPLHFGEDGDGIQLGPAGERWCWPAASFTSGTILGRRVRCVAAAQQIEWHQGYEPRATDLADLAVLRRLRPSCESGLDS